MAPSQTVSSVPTRRRRRGPDAGGPVSAIRLGNRSTAPTLNRFAFLYFTRARAFSFGAFGTLRARLYAATALYIKFFINKNYSGRTPYTLGRPAGPGLVRSVAARRLRGCRPEFARSRPRRTEDGKKIKKILCAGRPVRVVRAALLRNRVLSHRRWIVSRWNFTRPAINGDETPEKPKYRSIGVGDVFPRDRADLTEVFHIAFYAV